MLLHQPKISISLEKLTYKDATQTKLTTIGSLIVELAPQFTTKDNVDHAGPFLPLKPLNLISSLLDQLTTLSMEQIVSCDTAGEDQGCGGGFPTGAYTYVEGAGGIEDYNDFPYNAEGGEAGSCTFNSGDIVATVTNYNSINGETGLYQQMSSSSGGPVSVCVDASSWQNYEGGVLSTCGNDVDHCVQATGYANYGESGAYWIVRNSWGTDWGLSGFINIEIGQDLCSIGDYATVVTATTA